MTCAHFQGAFPVATKMFSPFLSFLIPAPRWRMRTRISHTDWGAEPVAGGRWPRSGQRTDRVRSAEQQRRQQPQRSPATEPSAAWSSRVRVFS